MALGAITSDVLPYGIAGVLLVAGLFQLSPLTQVCLRTATARSGSFSAIGARVGVAAWQWGWAHAVYCLGCCWALMVVLVAAGAMGFPRVLLISAVVAAEKLLPWGEWIARVTGVALVLLGVAVAVWPDVAMALRAGSHLM